MSSTGATPRTILLVEDEPLIRMMVAEYLRECGYRVREAADAAEAMELVTSGGIDLVFTDVDMPGPMDGFGLARWLRDRHPGLPVLIASGLPRMAEMAEDLCADGPLLVKPYDCAALAARIGSLLALSQQRGARGEEYGCGSGAHTSSIGTGRLICYEAAQGCRPPRRPIGRHDPIST